MIIVWKKFYNMLRRIQDPYDNDNICIVYASISRCYKGLHYRQFRHQRSEPGSWLVINVPTDHQYSSTTSQEKNIQPERE